MEIILHFLIDTMLYSKKPTKTYWTPHVTNMRAVLTESSIFSFISGRCFSACFKHPVLQKLSQLILEEHSLRETGVDSLYSLPKPPNWSTNLQSLLPRFYSPLCCQFLIKNLIVTLLINNLPYPKNFLQVKSEPLSSAKKAPLNWYQPTLVLPCISPFHIDYLKS